MIRPSSLKTAILSKYKSITAFCVATNYPRTKMYRLLNGEQEIKISDIRFLVKVLELEPNTIVDTFNLI